MATETLTLPNLSNQVNRQVERLMMLQELTRLAIESLPNNTDSDVPMALLNGMQEMLSTDAGNMHRLFQRLENQAASEVTHA